MAFQETASAARIVEGWCPIKITLAGTVAAGDPLMYSTGWVLATRIATEPPLLVAGEPGVSGEEITAFPLANVKVTTTATNVATKGEVVAVADDGSYYAAASTMPDVGFVASVGSDSLSAILSLCPAMQIIATKRT
jgi:hypothetical protein